MSDLTVKILTQIRDEIGGLRVDLNARIDETNRRLDETNVRLGRVEQGLVDLGQFTRGLALDMSRFDRWHSNDVRKLYDQVDGLKIRMDRVEDRLTPRPEP